MKALALCVLAVGFLAGCAGEAYVAGPAPAPVYVEPYPYDPYFYGPDVYVAPGYRERHWSRQEPRWNAAPRYDRSHPYRYVPPATGRPPRATHGRGSSDIPLVPNAVAPIRRDRR